MNHKNPEFLPLRRALLAGQDNDLKVLFRVQGVPHPTEHVRPPLNLALVIDRSGSMQGRPLEEAKRAAEHIVDHLDARDTVSVVSYDSHVRVEVPATRVSAHGHIKPAIRSIQCGGTTNLFDGWLSGAEQAATAMDGYETSRVLLLSDGCANSGLVNPAEISERVAQLGRKGVSTSTYGLGHGFNEELMTEIARAGGGNAYYGERAKDLMDPFQEEFALLSATCARNLRLQLRAPDGVQLELMNQFDQAGPNTWVLPDLAYESEVWAMIRLRVPAALLNLMQGGATRILEGRLTLDGSTVNLDPLALEPVSPGAYDAIAENAVVRSRLLELRAAELQDKARRRAERGDWPGVERVLQRARRELAESEWLESTVRTLEVIATQRDYAHFVKVARYGADRMRRRRTGLDEQAGGAYNVACEVPKAAYLRRKQDIGKRIEDQ